MIIKIEDITQLYAAAKELLEYVADKRILAFYGSMGAGKTTIIKAVCQELGVSDIISSPTFTLVNEYLTDQNEPVYHIDFYRIKKQEEVYDFGIEEYLSGEFYCMMEWPELIEELLPPETVSIRITVDANDVRTLCISDD